MHELLELFVELTNRVGLIIMLAFVFSKTSAFKNVFVKKDALTFSEKVIMALFYGGLGILGSLSGIAFKGAIVNTRVIGVVVGGLLGGPLVGAMAGAFAGIHRYMIDPGGMTSFACAVSTIVEGVFAGYLSHRFWRTSKPVIFAWLTGSVAEILQMAILLLLVRPLAYAENLVSIISGPMIIMNAIGIAVFIAITQNIKQLQDSEAAFRAEQTLRIADRTSQFFRMGLTSEAAIAITDIILEMTDFSAVAMTDEVSILAHTGMGNDHKRVGENIETDMTRHVLMTGEPLINQNVHAINEFYSKHNLKSAILVPLKLKQKTVGTLKLYKDKENDIKRVDEELAIGLANLFSTQLELSQIEEEKSLRDKAELNALQAQINPHFLFNAINTIVSLIRTDPDQARELMIHLGDYYRNNMQFNKDMIPIKDELKHIEAYLKIEKARFGDKLQIIYEVDQEIERKVPPLLVQPLVENAVKHGIFPKESTGTIHIRVYEKDKFLRIEVEDDGVGMDGKINDDSIGLMNVEKRLKVIYGHDYEFDIESEKNNGTKVMVSIGEVSV
ncbi:LytS/YhcK type 5TM receptor domain-containing protein [Acidaminobacter sp. JC074]|uniref:LytS/YhcK type 5TM receptor domain-containing protein n=1 Tax=Acidaminobacter sp. JC074 TaxID=2530199 RepID=UPI001F0EDB63|nr:LytS/YhcK type 5TM receptor domain-containing protein [Acidaminobacter sp. JC074]